MTRRILALLMCLFLLLCGSALAERTTRAAEFGTGDLRVLVLPIGFADSPFPEEDLALLELALSGDPEEVGWESVVSFYEKASYGALRLTFDIAPVYTCPREAEYYERDYARLYGNDSAQDEELAVHTVMSFLHAAAQLVSGLGEESGPYARYDTEERILYEALLACADSVDFSLYDRNGDRCLYAAVMVYAHKEDYVNDDTLWWSWQNYSDMVLPDGHIAQYFAWISAEELRGTAGHVRPKACSTTFIHEFGHVLGLPDYYDTTDGDSLIGGLGGFDMMDDDYGDHCAFSKLVLGWIEPILPTEEYTHYLLTPLSEHGDVLLLRKPGSRGEGAFGEYLLIDLFSPEGLNKAFAGQGGTLSRPGVRIYHVDATPARGNALDFYSDPFSRNNSYGPHKLLSLVEADGNDSISDPENDGCGYPVCNDDLFHEGDELTGLCWYDGTPVGCAIRVEALGDGFAVVSIVPEDREDSGPDIPEISTELPEHDISAVEEKITK